MNQNQTQDYQKRSISSWRSRAEESKLDRRLIVALAIIALDATALGLTMPNLPALLRQVTGSEDVGTSFGAYFGIMALLQVLFLPLLGGLSDKYGRKPVLILAAAGTTMDYMVSSITSVFWFMIVSRAVMGMTVATIPTVVAYIADIVDKDHRTRWYGRMGASLMLGIVIGPAAGGYLGEFSARAPFILAAVLALCNLMMTIVFLRESHSCDRRLVTLKYNPFGPMRWLLGQRALLPMLGAFVLVNMIGQLGGTMWPLYGGDYFKWSSTMIGLSLTVFALINATAQAWLSGPLAERLGETRVVMLGMTCESLGYIGVGLVSVGWMALGMIPLMCMGGLSMPAITSMLSSEVDEEHQGRLQGALGSITSIAMALSPAALGSSYYATKDIYAGTVWIVGGALYLLYIPILIRLGMRRRRPGGPEAETLAPTLNQIPYP